MIRTAVIPTESSAPGSPATGLRRWGGRLRGPQRQVFVAGVVGDEWRNLQLIFQLRTAESLRFPEGTQENSPEWSPLADGILGNSRREEPQSRRDVRTGFYFHAFSMRIAPGMPAAPYARCPLQRAHIFNPIAVGASLVFDFSVMVTYEGRAISANNPYEHRCPTVCWMRAKLCESETSINSSEVQSRWNSFAACPAAMAFTALLHTNDKMRRCSGVSLASRSMNG